MTEFNVGDRVLVLSPERDAAGNEDVDYGPGWVRDMDDFVGRECTVRRITAAGYILLSEDDDGWKFDPAFLIRVNEPLEESNEGISNFLGDF